MILQGIREKEIFTDNSPFRMAVSTHTDFTYPSHWHNAIELIYTVDDRCTVTVNNTEYVMEENEILIVAIGDIHGFRINNSKGTRYFIQLDYAKLMTVCNDSNIQANQIKTTLISAKDNMIHDLLEEQILKIIHEYKNRKHSSVLYFYARFFDICVSLSYLFEHNYGLKENRVTELTKLDKAFEYIMENYQKQITLSEIAAHVGFSEYYFSRVFKKATEKNFHTYLNEYRVEMVEKLLYNHCNITEAAYACGFNSLVTFNRIFKQYKGCSPSEFMKKRV